MKNIYLESLDIQNFKGVTNLSISFDERAEICGANATGKTTLVDAFLWLLFGKDSSGRSDFQIRPVDAEGKLVDDVEISVEGKLLISDHGEEPDLITLKKTQKQVWTKKRGSSVQTFTGNRHEYEIDGYPASQKEYELKVSSILNEGLFRLLTDPRTFARMPWKDQREILLRFVSGVTDEQILSSYGNKYDPISADVIAAGADKAREKAVKDLKLLNDKQKEYPTRIDEATRSLTEVPDMGLISSTKEKYNAMLEEVRAERNDLNSVLDKVSGIQSRIIAVGREMGQIESDEEKKATEARFQARMAYTSAKNDVLRLEQKYDSNSKQIAMLESGISEKESQIKSLTDEYKTVRARVLPTDDTICPTCGREYDSTKLEEIQNEFDSRKERDLSRIETKGKQIRSAVTKDQEFLANLNKEQEELTEAIKQKKKYAESLQSASEAPETAVDLFAIPKYCELASERDRLNEQLSAMDTQDSRKKDLDDREREALDGLKTLAGYEASIEANKRTSDRISSLKAEQLDCSQKITEQEEKLYLLEEFIRAKMDMLSEQINQHFKSVRFKLFEQQINGGIKDTCVMQINTNGSYVDYQNSNHAAQIQGGIDVINALSELYGVTAPIWLDNSEAINGYNIPETQAQMILLRVTDDKELKY